MSDLLTLTLTAALSTSGTTDITETSAAEISVTETFWAQVTVDPAASDVVLLLNLLTDPSALVVIGAKGISFKLDSTGTDLIAADPIAVVSDDDAGLAIDQILLTNTDSQSHVVTVIAVE